MLFLFLHINICIRGASNEYPQHMFYGELEKLSQSNYHYENMPNQLHWKFYHQNLKIFIEKKSDIFHISAQNIVFEQK